MKILQACQQLQPAMCWQPAAEQRPKLLPVARQANRSMVPQLKRLLSDVCEAVHVPEEAVRRHTRHASVVFARACFWWLARRFYGFSYPELARLEAES